MAVFKCKMCGGTIEFEPGASVGICDSCGTKQTLPRLDDRRAALYERANRFRRSNDFDKAMGIYEQILNEDSTDAEAYWSIVLCRYGVEYVEDPASHRRIPTVNRAQFTSIFADEDYKAALQYADGAQRAIYEDEARAIDELQKGILRISAKEEPFDVFICYKETDTDGRRTRDSVLANELYHQLTLEGFKVFFSRITLEDKLGTAYEPYIFAALNSAKVMVVLGTKPEYFNAVWVRNEWSRYLALVKQSGGKKILIPAYRDMDPYDLPEEFSHLQAQDMSRLGFMQDLIRGIKKIIGTDAPRPAVRETVAVSETAAATTNVAPLLKRAFMFLEDGNFREADEYCEKVLDQEPENAMAYLGKLMAELHARKQDELADCYVPFDDDGNYQKAIRFGDKALVDALEGYNARIRERDEKARMTEIYDDARRRYEAAQTQKACLHAASLFESIASFRDAMQLAAACREKAEVCRKDEIYNAAKVKMHGTRIESYEEAIRDFETLPGWKDAAEQIDLCREKIEALKAAKEEQRIADELAEEKRRKTVKKAGMIAAVAVVVIVCLLIKPVIIPAVRYRAAVSLENEGNYDEAISAFEALGDYRDSAEQILACRYGAALAFADKGNYTEAIAEFETLGDYQDSAEQIWACRYNDALALADEGNYAEAIVEFKALGDYQDSKQKISEIKTELLRTAEVGNTVYFGNYEQDDDDSDGKEPIAWRVLAKENNRILVISNNVIDHKPYNKVDNFINFYSSYGTIKLSLTPWEICSLRTWLNDTFLNEAFNSEEQAMIPYVTVTANSYCDYDGTVYPANDTTDQVFLLSVDEANQYFDSDTARSCDEWWWLRTPVEKLAYANYTVYTVSDHGIISTPGYTFRTSLGVRPAMWIDVSGL